MAAAHTQTWHPVTPQIADPDLVPPQASTEGIWGVSAEPAPPVSGEGLFARHHRFTLVALVVVLIICIVVVYVYLTRRGGNKKKSRASGREALQGVSHSEEMMDLDELNRLRAMRQQQQSDSLRWRRQQLFPDQRPGWAPDVGQEAAGASPPVRQQRAPLDSAASATPLQPAPASGSSQTPSLQSQQRSVAFSDDFIDPQLARRQQKMLKTADPLARAAAEEN
ncbi:hypothetical protein ElyMa_002505200, partial [Elysia marginata]